jgi:hypothetical protein
MLPITYDVDMAHTITAILCEYASTSADGTTTLVRAGLEVWTPPSLPIEIAPWVFVQVDPGSLAIGERQAKIELISPDGLVLAAVHVQLAVVNPEFPARFAAPLRANIQAYGEFKIHVEIESLQKDIRLSVKKRELAQ